MAGLVATIYGFLSFQRPQRRRLAVREEIAFERLAETRLVLGGEHSAIGRKATIETLADLLHPLGNPEVADPHLPELLVHVGEEYVEHLLRDRLTGLALPPEPAEQDSTSGVQWAVAGWSRVSARR